MKRCVLPRGSSAARWRQACARFYATKDAAGEVKRGRGRPPKQKVEDRLEPGNGGTISTGGAGALPASIGIYKPFRDTNSTPELQRPSPKARGRPRKVKRPEISLDEGGIKGRTDGAGEPSEFDASNASPTSMSSFKLTSTSELKGPVRSPKGGRPKEEDDEMAGLDRMIATAVADLAPSHPLPHSAEQVLAHTSSIDRVNVIHPPRERPLPISPLMDPEFWAAREKHKVRKDPPTKGPPGSLHARLAKNPYALALATPIRCCAVTGALLPTFFLQDYNMMAHPETGEPWYVPLSLGKHDEEKTKLKKKKSSSKGTLEVALSKPLDVQDVQDAALETGANKGKKIGHNAYTLSSLLALNQMRQNNFHSSKLIPQRLRRISSASKTAAAAGWREDMGSFIRELWRRRISEDLIHVKGLKNGYMINCIDWEDAKAKSQVGAFLWIGKSIEGAPKQWATIDVPYGHERFGETRKVPVYNLRTLLGDRALEILVGGEDGGKSILDGSVVVVKDKRVTLELRMKLWKFQGFMALPEAQKELVYDDGEEDDEDWDEDDEDFADEEDEENDTEELGDEASRKNWTIRPSDNEHTESPRHIGRPRESTRRQNTERLRQNRQPSRVSQGFTLRRE